MMRLQNVIFLILLSHGCLFSQSSFETTFEKQMVEYELDVVRTYNELQNFLTHSTPNATEQIAFEHLISIYVDHILEIFNTMQRLAGTTLETYRGVTARALIFRSLTYLERVNPTNDNYQKAIADYKKALELYQNGRNITIINKRLPYEIWIGNKMYTRLADLLDDKSKGFELLNSFNR